MSDGSSVLFRGKGLVVKKDAIEVKQTIFPMLMVKSADISSEDISSEGLGFFLWASVFMSFLSFYILFYVVYLFIDSQNVVRDCASGIMADGCLGGMFGQVVMVNYFMLGLAAFLIWVARQFWKMYSKRTRLVRAGAKIHQVNITTPAVTAPIIRTPDTEEAQKVLKIIKDAIGQR